MDPDTLVEQPPRSSIVSVFVDDMVATIYRGLLPHHHLIGLVWQREQVLELLGLE